MKLKHAIRPAIILVVKKGVIGPMKDFPLKGNNNLKWRASIKGAIGDLYFLKLIRKGEL